MAAVQTERRCNIPGFFGDQADRLLRKKWDDPYELAQELWAMFQADVPMTTDQPVILRRNADGEPAIRIIDNTDGSTSPVRVVKTDGKVSQNANVDSGGKYQCCGGSGQNGQPKTPKDPSKTGGKPGGGDVEKEPPPKDSNVPYREFNGTVRIKIHQGAPDFYHWNGLEPSFTAFGCFPYRPPTINAPVTAFDERFKDPDGTIQEQINVFMAHNGLDGYTVMGDSISAPGLPCEG